MKLNKAIKNFPLEFPCTIAIDFDGTCVEENYENWPELGPEMPGCTETLRALVAAGHELILYTCREDDPGSDAAERNLLTPALEWFEERGIPLAAVNTSTESRNPDFEWLHRIARKPYAEIYIDDKSLEGFPGWKYIHELLLGNGHKYGNYEHELFIRVGDTIFNRLNVNDVSIIGDRYIPNTRKTYPVVVSRRNGTDLRFSFESVACRGAFLSWLYAKLNGIGMLGEIWNDFG